jgi:hypothetical protein
MYAVIRMSGKFYATKKSLSFNKIDETIEYIETFTIEGTPVTFVNELEDAAELFDIDEDDITIV